jgi:hypothetical protein
MSRTLQVFVIGQSPRLDIEAQVAPVARDAKISVEGVLDGMSLEQIADRVVPESDRYAVFATLSSGDTVTVSEQMVTTRLSAKLETGGPALLWSTASFQDLLRARWASSCPAAGSSICGRRNARGPVYTLSQQPLPRALIMLR